MAGRFRYGVFGRALLAFGPLVLIAVAVVQEETTFGGATTTAHSLRPDIAIAVARVSAVSDIAPSTARSASRLRPSRRFDRSPRS